MTQFLVSISTWLHAIATVVFIGYFTLMAVIVLPALSKNGPALSEISKSSRLWMYASLIVFAITGTHLMLIDSGYLGFMDFGNFWGIVMLVKHILVIAMIGKWVAELFSRRRMCSVACRPPMTGICRSIKTTSKSSCAVWSKAS